MLEPQITQPDPDLFPLNISHATYPRTWEAETGKLPRIQGQPRVLSELQAS